MCSTQATAFKSASFCAAGLPTVSKSPNILSHSVLTQIDYWWRTARKSQIEINRNNRLRHITEVENTVVEVTEQKDWYGTVILEEGRIPKAQHNESLREEGRGGSLGKN